MKTFEEWKAENLDLSDMDAGRIGNSIILTGLEKCWHDAHDVGFAEGLTARKESDPKREELLKLASSLAVGVLTQGSAVRITDVTAITSVAAAIIAEVDRVSGASKAGYLAMRDHESDFKAEWAKNELADETAISKQFAFRFWLAARGVEA